MNRKKSAISDRNSVMACLPLIRQTCSSSRTASKMLAAMLGKWASANEKPEMGSTPQLRDPKWCWRMWGEHSGRLTESAGVFLGRLLPDGD